MLALRPKHDYACGGNFLKFVNYGAKSLYYKDMSHYSFTGEYTCSLDSKNRFNIPSGIRKMIGAEANDTLVFAPGFENSNLYVYPLDEWRRIIANIGKNSPNSEDVRKFVRLFVSSGHTVTMDGQGRVMLPNRILEKAGIKRDLLILGTINRFEIWSPESYDSYVAKDDMDVGELAQKINFTDLNYCGDS